MFIRNWRFEQLLLSRKRGSLKLTAWPDTKQCQVLKDFIYRGQQLFAFDRYKGITGDAIELEAAEAKELQSKGLVAAYPSADRFKIGQHVGWKRGPRLRESIV